VVERAAAICRRAVEQIARLTWSDIDHVILVGGQTLMPAVEASVAALAGKQPHKLARPQEVVALGAGVYAHIISQGEQVIQQQLLTNVVALPVGIHLPLETPSFRPLIQANSELPIRSQPYIVKPAHDNETSIEVEVLQGKQHDAASFAQCDLIGVVRIENIEPGKSEERPFSIVLEAEEDGILKVRVGDPLDRLESRLFDITEQRISVHRVKAG
jgi:molecular chaperone DnaK